MRLIFSVFMLVAFAAPAMADDANTSQKPALIKGSKSYQVRYTKTDKAPEVIEPAAGDETKARIEPTKKMKAEQSKKSVDVQK